MLDARRRREARGRIVGIVRGGIALGASLRRTACVLRLAPQTVRDWMRRDAPGAPGSRGPGRPRRLPGPEERLRMGELLAETRGEASVRALRAAAPGAARRALERSRSRYRRRLRRHMEHLVWTWPGAVWAADYTDPPSPVDGRLRHVLCVRDVASGRQLAALAVAHADSATAARVVDALCAEHGPPLVLKTDNGSHFKGALSAVVERWEAAQLLSPPATPRYNGSIEAGIGALAALAQKVALADGRRGPLTSLDLETARHTANHREDGAGWRAALGHTAEERWRSRKPISRQDRAAFRTAVAAALVDETAKLQQRRAAQAARMPTAAPCRTSCGSDDAGAPPPAPASSPSLNRTDRAAAARRATRRALVAIGALATWRHADMST